MNAESPITHTVKPTRYLVCMDQQPESRVALQLSCMRARGRNGRVDIVHVIPPSDFPNMFSVADRMKEEQRAEGEKFLQTLAEEVQAMSGLQPGLILREGQVGDEIIATAQENVGVNILVLGVAHNTSGRGKLVSWLAGQLGTKLFTPMLLVPGNLTDDQLLALL